MGLCAVILELKQNPPPQPGEVGRTSRVSIRSSFETLTDGGWCIFPDQGGWKSPVRILLLAAPAVSVAFLARVGWALQDPDPRPEKGQGSTCRSAAPACLGLWQVSAGGF